MDKIISTSGVPFNYGQHQDIVQMLNHIERSGKTVEDYKEWVYQKPIQDNARLEQERQHWEDHAPKCPDCGRSMTLQALEDNDCHWICKCGYGVYSPNSIRDELIKYGLAER